jgi:hypothetical protein
MTTWEILIGQKVIATFDTDVKSWWHADEVVQRWEEMMSEKNPDVWFPTAITARRKKTQTASK